MQALILQGSKRFPQRLTDVKAEEGVFTDNRRNRCRKGESIMLDFTEKVLNVTIWALSAAGLFFGLRSARKKRRRDKGTKP